jgi:Flp pilus assembly protein TadB
MTKSLKRYIMKATPEVGEDIEKSNAFKIMIYITIIVFIIALVLFLMYPSFVTFVLFIITLVPVILIFMDYARRKKQAST